MQQPVLREKVRFISGGIDCVGWHYPGTNGGCVVMAAGGAVTKIRAPIHLRDDSTRPVSAFLPSTTAGSVRAAGSRASTDALDGDRALKPTDSESERPAVAVTEPAPH